MDVFLKEAPQVAEAFNGLIRSIVVSKGLDEKMKQLIYIALKAANRDETAVKFHVLMARQLGATKEEVVDAILVTLTVCGISGVTSCLPVAIDCFQAG